MLQSLLSICAHRVLGSSEFVPHPITLWCLFMTNVVLNLRMITMQRCLQIQAFLKPKQTACRPSYYGPISWQGQGLRHIYRFYYFATIQHGMCHDLGQKGIWKIKETLKGSKATRTRLAVWLFVSQLQSSTHSSGRHSWLYKSRRRT